jgi:K+-sensing histidine kinase KdpD
VRLTIEDGGPGVPPSDLEHIFDKFGRTSRPGEGARRGMGVGLSIVQGMAVALDGNATARRSELGGLAIDIDLPAAPEPPVEEVAR